MVVVNPGIRDFHVDLRGEVERTAFFPHGDGVLLGSVCQPGDWNLKPDRVVAQGILARCATAEPRFADAKVLGHQVGLRPGRPAVRVERDGRVIHHYGHAGQGLSLSWGSAQAVAALLLHSAA